MDTRSGHGTASGGSTATPSAAGASAREGSFEHDASSPSPGDTASGQAASNNVERGPAAAERLVEEFGDLGSAIRLLVAARYDQFRLTLRRVVLLAILAMVAVCGLAALAASACVLLVVGIAGAISQWTGAAPWVGQLLTAVGLIAGGGLIGFVLLRLWQQSSLRKTLKRYGKLDR